MELRVKVDFCHMINRIKHLGTCILKNLLNSLWKRDKMSGKPCILSLFHSSFNKFNKI